MRKRWTGLATALALVSSALVLNGTINAEADHAGGSWTLFAAGDVADPTSPGDEMNAALIKAGIDADPDHTRVLMLGDGAYPDGTIDTYNREYGKADGWGQFKDKTYPVPGNHDYGKTMGSANNGYRLYWDSLLKSVDKSGGGTGDTLSDHSGWYSVELGNWHIIALNWACGTFDPGETVKGSGDSCRADGNQAKWLAEDLQRAKANNKHIMAMWHGARFFTKNDNGTPDKPADDPRGGNSSDAAKTNLYWQMLHDAGAEMVLGSHHHNYERFDRMSVRRPDTAPAGDDQGQVDPTGPRSFVVGTGGGDLHKFNPDGGSYAVGSVEGARIDNRFGVLKLVLGENNYSWQFIASDNGEVLDQGNSATLKTVNGGGGSSSTTVTTGGGSTTTTTLPGGNVNPTNRRGYWMVGADGKVYPFGQAARLGDAGVTPGTEAVDLEPTPTGDGYWVVDEAGAVARFGDALYHGAPDSLTLKADEKVTSLSSTKTGKGYWMFTNKGRVLAFGDAKHHGDLNGKALNAPVLDSIVTSSGLGYYMVAADGGIFTFGDAAFFGSTGNIKLNKPVQSLVPAPNGSGYWLVASDGGIFAFGSAPFKGSLGNVKLNKPVTGMVRFADGYLMVGEDGGIFNFSSQDFLGSLGKTPPARPIVSVAALG